MSQRTVRVNELVKRELGEMLRTQFQEQTVAITITEVDVSPDLRNARVFYSVLGDEAASRDADDFFARHGKELRYRLGRRIVLKYLPALNFIEDESIERGNRVLEILDELDRDEPG